MKTSRIIRIVVTVIFLVITLFLVIVSIKPGAAIFFDKREINPESVEIMGKQIVYPIHLSQSYYDLDTLLVRENGILLKPIKVEELPNWDTSAFGVETVGEDDFLIKIIPVSRDPQNVNLASIEILIRPIFITHPMVKILAVVFSLGVVLTLISVFARPATRKKITSGFFGFLKIWDDPLQIGAIIKRKSKLFLTVISQAVYVSFFFVFMEWLFFITKPSFLDILTFGQKLGVIFGSSLFLWIAIAGMILVIFILDIVNSLTTVTLVDGFYSFPSAFVLTVTALLLVDNFTYTVFNFGVTTTASWLRLFYGVGLILAFIFFVRYLSGKAEKSGGKKQTKLRLVSAGGFLLVAIISMAIQFNPISIQTENNISTVGVRTPNIILVSDDGVNAENMSLYGYERETTPFLDSMAQSSLLMLNNFTNANTSTGSDTSMLTGKLPFETGVLYSPDTLEGLDTIEHLPGTLKQLGYHTMSIGVPTYVDMGVINLQNGFDSINGNTSAFTQFITFASSYGYNDVAYFSRMSIVRVLDRLLHISYIKDLDNPYLMVTEPTPISVWMNLDEAFDLLTNNLNKSKQSNQPLFAHVHLISTHGAYFYPREPFYSKGQEQTEGWMTDFYDDAILEYDQWLEELVGYLKDQGLYDNTIIIFYTDHAEKWTVDQRIPLMIHFPNDEYSGEILANTQNLDIAPTIVDYLGLDVPEWMTGESLLGDLNRDRLIYSAQIDVNALTMLRETADIEKPPFFKFQYIAVTQCQYMYKINLDTMSMVRKTIDGYLIPCEEEILASPDQIWDSVLSLLSNYGYENLPTGDGPGSYEIE